MRMLSMVVVKLEREILHIHPALQKVFYELPNIHDPKAKKIATITLMHEFNNIIREAREIFSYYNKKIEQPPIEVLHNKETTRGLESKDLCFSTNLRKRVPFPEVIQTLYLGAYENFDWVTKGRQGIS